MSDPDVFDRFCVRGELEFFKLQPSALLAVLKVAQQQAPVVADPIVEGCSFRPEPLDQFVVSVRQCQKHKVSEAVFCPLLCRLLVRGRLVSGFFFFHARGVVLNAEIAFRIQQRNQERELGTVIVEVAVNHLERMEDFVDVEVPLGVEQGGSVQLQDLEKSLRLCVAADFKGVDSVEKFFQSGNVLRGQLSPGVDLISHPVPVDNQSFFHQLNFQNPIVKLGQLRFQMELERIAAKAGRFGEDRVEDELKHFPLLDKFVLVEVDLLPEPGQVKLVGPKPDHFFYLREARLNALVRQVVSRQNDREAPPHKRCVWKVDVLEQGGLEQLEADHQGFVVAFLVDLGEHVSDSGKVHVFGGEIFDRGIPALNFLWQFGGKFQVGKQVWIRHVSQEGLDRIGQNGKRKLGNVKLAKFDDEDGFFLIRSEKSKLEIDVVKADGLGGPVSAGIEYAPTLVRRASFQLKFVISLQTFERLVASLFDSRQQVHQEALKVAVIGRPLNAPDAAVQLDDLGHLVVVHVKENG